MVTKAFRVVEWTPSGAPETPSGWALDVAQGGTGGENYADANLNMLGTPPTTPFAIDWILSNSVVNPRKVRWAYRIAGAPEIDAVPRCAPGTSLLNPAWIPVFGGATSIDDGARGAVPQPLAGQQGMVLLGSGIWGAPGTPTLPLTVKGSIITHDGLTSVELTSTGEANNTMLEVQSGQPTGLRWGPAWSRAPVADCIPRCAPASDQINPAFVPFYTPDDGISDGTRGIVPGPTAGMAGNDYFLSADGGWLQVTGGGGSGEVNTASNVGTGTGWFKQKTVFDLEFKTVLGTNGIAVSSGTSENTLDGSDLMTMALMGM